MAKIENRESEVEHRLPADALLRRVRWDAAQVEAWRALLSEAERGRLDGYGVEKRRREFLLGRVAARQLLAGVLGCAPAEAPMEVAGSGAVEVRGGHGLRLSISHTGAEAVAAVAERPVGADLERIQPRPERLHRFLLAEAERPLLEQRALSADAAFALCWALKEATLKALGCGLRRSPKTVRIAKLNAEARTARLEARGGETASFEAQFARDGKLWLVVAYEAGDRN
ncbi:MAG: 4'-phosphopantetheinyl transferase [Bacteroidetes bacterium QS_9_68_14]|nr:MAG: 4'-phosphopantetheinyl transferase [Bacteroidetes bacterium QS_9_68_14]